MEAGGRVKGFRTEFILPGSWKRLSPKEIVKSFTTLWQAGEKLRQLRQTGVEWRIWSPKAVVEARAAGHPVLVCFSADWCLVSKYNQHKAIEVKPVFQKLEKIKGVAFFADYTEKNPEITKALQRHKRAGPPLVLVYPPKGNPIILPPVMNSPEKILEALDKATPPR